jgi:hypothetical protein
MFNVFKASFFIQSAPSISFLLYKRSTNTKSKESKKRVISIIQSTILPQQENQKAKHQKKKNKKKTIKKKNKTKQKNKKETNEYE